MPKIDVAGVAPHTGSRYPEPLKSIVKGRSSQALGDAAGLSQFGVNLVRLEPGAASALRHWHEAEDEFVWMVDGELVLIEDDGETVLRPGDAAGFKAGAASGHHLVNRTDRAAVFLVVGSRAARERVHYPDVDLAFERDESGLRFTRKSGESY